MRYCGKLPKNYKLGIFWGRVRKADVCVKLWLAGIYFLVRAIFVASKLWIWQQFNFLAGQRASLYWNCMLGNLTQHFISIYFCMLLLYCWYICSEIQLKHCFLLLLPQKICRASRCFCVKFWGPKKPVVSKITFFEGLVDYTIKYK